MLISSKNYLPKNKLTIVGFVVLSAFNFVFAADISVYPNSGSYSVGKTFTVDINITGNDKSINAVSGALSFSEELLQVKSFSKDGSIIKLWAENPSYSNASGMIKFEGVILNPGYTAPKGKVLSVTFLVKKEGNAVLNFSSGSVLANDGEATNIVGNLSGGNYSLVATTQVETAVKETTSSTITEVKKVTGLQTPVIISTTHPDSNAWYKSKDVSFAWDLPENVTAVKTLYDEHSSSNPTKVYDPAISNRNFTVDKDGIYYMHVQFKTEQGWGAVAHYKFQIDSSAPSYLKLTFPSGNESYDPTPILVIDSKDTLSGIDHATIKINNTPLEQITPDRLPNYRLSAQNSGSKTATVAIFDKAGNTITQSIDFTVISIDIPVITDYTRQGEEGDVMKVIGTTYPNSTVEVVYTDRNGIRVSDTAKSDVDGNFTMLWTKKLIHGAYDLKVRVTDTRGAISDYTNSKVVLVDRKAYVQFGLFIINWITLILLVIVSITSVAATLWYSFVQFGRFRRKVRRTIHEAETTLKANVLALRRDTEEFHTILVKAEKKRELTKEETAILRKFKKRLEITEKEIEKKLEQIG